MLLLTFNDLKQQQKRTFTQKKQLRLRPLRPVRPPVPPSRPDHPRAPSGGPQAARGQAPPRRPRRRPLPPPRELLLVARREGRRGGQARGARRRSRRESAGRRRRQARAAGRDEPGRGRAGRGAQGRRRRDGGRGAARRALAGAALAGAGLPGGSDDLPRDVGGVPPVRVLRAARGRGGVEGGLCGHRRADRRELRASGGCFAPSPPTRFFFFLYFRVFFSSFEGRKLFRSSLPPSSHLFFFSPSLSSSL